MIQQLKLQLNLYSHREEDLLILEKLGLLNCNNPNKKLKEILIDIANGNMITSEPKVIVKEVIKEVPIEKQVQIEEKKLNNKLISSAMTMEL